ncbi:type IV secretion system DNA-binding domain-containing protein [Shewanella sp. Isolate13]|uniref:type IV secretion system DNA-binding domain-containing protein n=1 Tax=Shewanella sp. Isolate13 TaxID=2908531 RepID=UPI001EFC5944|nr:type IV secretion system DNA-binding domain-containing protein [Shewanella sp. Isolate13]MCG9729598.1 type IV secretion system DNA-binding domain-containing protein [Shewanella sp. Isolate13]
MTLPGRYQRWGLIVFLTIIVTLLLSYYFTMYTWQFVTPWPSFEAHRRVLVNIFYDTFSQDSTTLTAYIHYLKKNNWLDDFIYHLLAPLIVSAYLTKELTISLFYVDGGVDRANHVEGPQLYVGYEAYKHAKKCFRRMKGKSNSPLKIHNHIKLPEQLESGNIFVVGAQGSGKSTIIKPLVQQLKSKNTNALIYDAKQEYTQLFFESSAVLINPLDQRSIYWDISADIGTIEAAQRVAEAFIHETSGDKYWTDGARIIFVGILVTLMKTEKSWGWTDIQLQLAQETSHLKTNLFKHYPEADKFIERDSKTTQGFMTVLTTQLSWIRTVAQHWANESKFKFSIKKWLVGDYGNRQIIFPNIAQYSHISSPLCAAAISLLTDELLSKEDTEKPIWLVIDELADLPKTISIVKWLSLGRSKGARTIAGTQNISQIYSTYGDKDAETLISLFSNSITLRTNSADSASRLSKNIGNRVVKRYTESFDHEGNKSRTLQQSEEPVVRTEQIMQLPLADNEGVTGILNISGWNAAYWLLWPYSKLEVIAKGFIPKNTPAESTMKVNNRRGSRGREKSC